MAPEELEWKTRKDRIDKKLKSMNPSWDIIDYKSETDISKLHSVAVREYPTANGTADYAFFVKGKLLGVLEAKKSCYKSLEDANKIDIPIHAFDVIIADECHRAM